MFKLKDIALKFGEYTYTPSGIWDTLIHIC